MSVTEFLEEIPRLADEERQKIWLRLEEIELGKLQYQKETPELLAALDTGRHSVREGKVVSIEEARRLIEQWTPKLS